MIIRLLMFLVTFEYESMSSRKKVSERRPTAFVERNPMKLSTKSS